MSAIFTLLELPTLQDLKDVEADLRAREKLVGILKPRSAKTFPEPSSDLIGFRFFVLTRQLPCFRVSFLNQVAIPLRGLNTFLRFLLKGVQHINPFAKLDLRNDTINVRGIAQAASTQTDVSRVLTSVSSQHPPSRRNSVRR